MEASSYLPILLFIIIGASVGLVPIALGRLLGPHKPDAQKLSPYECGFETFEESRMRFDIRYYLVAILFILFDLETIFLFPWSLSLSELGAPSYFAMLLFLLEFAIGFLYIWKRGGLDWE